jgi:hypothetical protein
MKNATNVFNFVGPSCITAVRTYSEGPSDSGRMVFFPVGMGRTVRRRPAALDRPVTLVLFFNSGRRLPTGFSLYSRNTVYVPGCREFSNDPPTHTLPTSAPGLRASLLFTKYLHPPPLCLMQYRLALASCTASVSSAVLISEKIVRGKLEQN